MLFSLLILRETPNRQTPYDSISFTCFLLFETFFVFVRLSVRHPAPILNGLSVLFIDIVIFHNSIQLFIHPSVWCFAQFPHERSMILVSECPTAHRCIVHISFRSSERLFAKRRTHLLPMRNHQRWWRNPLIASCLQDASLPWRPSWAITQSAPYVVMGSLFYSIFSCFTRRNPSVFMSFMKYSLFFFFALSSICLSYQI